MRHGQRQRQLWRRRAAYVGLCALACGGGIDAPTIPALATLTLSLTRDSLYVEEAAQATLTGRSASGQPVPLSDIVWLSSAPHVASVSVRGVVVALDVGTTTITGSTGGRGASREVRVHAIPVSLIALAPTVFTLRPGEARQLTAIPLDAATRPLPRRPVSWLSTDTLRVVVSDSGLVTAVSPGLARVVAISEQAFASVEVRVSGPPGPVASVTIVPAATTITLGGTLQLAAILEDSIGNVATDRAVTWSSSNPAVAPVSREGGVVALAPGSVTIEARSGAGSGSARITVFDSADAIAVLFAAPDSNEVVSDTLLAYVTAASRNDIVRVHVRVANKETDLVRVPVGFFGARISWRGSLDLSDIHFGPYQLVATVYDDKGNVAVASQPFVRGARTGKGGTSIPPRNR